MKNLCRPISFSLLIFTSCFFLNEVSAHGGVSETGVRIYKERCTWCHGKEGRGDGPASRFLRPLPRDFTSGVYKFISSDLKSTPLDTDIYRAISNGIPGTAMPAWKEVLNTGEIEALVKVVKSFSRSFESGDVTGILKHGVPVPFSKESVKTGREVFNKALCFECHGKNGRGDGTRRLKDDRGDRVWPRDLTRPLSFKGGATPQDIFFRVSNGIPGTPMPGFGKKNLLTEDERWHLVNYVLSLGGGAIEGYNSETVVSSYTSAALPRNVDAPSWSRQPFSLIPLSPNLVLKERLFKPTNGFLKIKSLFNRDAIAFLLTWRDRTKSLPFGTASELLSEGPPLEDGIAIQFPVQTDDSFQIKPYLGHGERSSSVRTIYWGAGTPEAGKIFTGTGLKKRLRPFESSNVTTRAVYFNGEWKVLVLYRFGDKERKKSFLRTGRSIPVAFANWDGSNGERGSRHTLTAWYPLVLEHPENRSPFFIAAAAFIFFVVCQKLICMGISYFPEIA